MLFKHRNPIASIALCITGLFFFASGFSNFQSEEWEAPKEADNIKNPLAGDDEAASKGKKLYSTMCAICHGNKGKGDGMAGMNLKPRPTNLALVSVQGQTDGAIYWKITEGRPPMASYKQVLKEEQRWQLVNYIRTLGK